MFADTRAGRRFELFDNLVGVLIQKLVHRLSDHVVAVQMVRHAESATAEFEVDQQLGDHHVTNAVSFYFGALHARDRRYVTCKRPNCKYKKPREREREREIKRTLS